MVLTPSPGWNGFVFNAQIESGFRESGGSGIISTTASTTMQVVPTRDGIPGLVLNSTPLSVSQAPTSGAAKDEATGR